MTEKKAKVGRTVKLESDINDRLLSLCEHLGVNPNSYLINKIGEAISKDEVSYIASRHVANQNNELAKFFELIAKSAEE
jgi:hypothetical protein|tara:strand:+ start:1442 stop:1678 length:237 start_codon:yes stop_codon:yes gene_type:complete